MVARSLVRAALAGEELHAEEGEDSHEDEEEHADVEDVGPGADERGKDHVGALPVLDEAEEAQHAQQAEETEDGEVERADVLLQHRHADVEERGADEEDAEARGADRGGSSGTDGQRGGDATGGEQRARLRQRQAEANQLEDG